ncbi:MAG TPA: adenosylmethionine--8-amino-7-oxononanoate transaminase [Syntrophales bacterium]|jgi:adenosylmethionine-8-amino-7-oxononanoate aminotransferase|nr:adenosylmethionine--8-amino-7-oxononanoate transaminase [Syntrophales bacterium]HQA82367.1 adenosylmethionine--8-amino-7-oxononanoate transaminase [Syntrophales bacterium]
MEIREEEIRDLEKADLECIWHPFTQMQLYRREKPVIIEKGRGCRLYDIEGNAYLDGVSSLWTNVHGHAKAELDEALKAQTDLIAHSTLLGISSVPAIRFARKLLDVVPSGLTKVFYSDSGSTSVEIALKMAFQYHRQSPKGNPKKTKFLSFVNAYHGDTIGSVSLGGIDLFHEMYRELLFETYKVASPYCYRCPYGLDYPGCKLDCLLGVEKMLDEHHDEIAAVVLEPLVQGAAGMLMQPEGFLRGVRALCDHYGVFLIADEVAVGFGRTGKMFACEHEGVTPDILCLAKGISGGYLPLAATVTSEEIFDGFLGEFMENKTFFHGHTYTGNPLACAVAIASLELFEKERIIENLQPKITFLKNKLAAFKNLSHVGDIRQRGLMVGIELVADRNTREGLPVADRTGHQVILEARKRGVMIRPLGDIIVLMPPLAMSIEELDRLCEATYESIRVVTEKA